MSAELSILSLVLVLAIAQVLAPALGRTQQHGLKWNAGPRDEAVGPSRPVIARLERAQANLFETLPIYLAAALAAHVAGVENGLTFWGGALYLVARVAYVPLYAFGVSYARSLAWVASLIGIVMILIALFTAS